jgi:hypothetical protein
MQRSRFTITLFFCFLFSSVEMLAGNRYTYSNTSGNANLSPSATKPALKAGDTLDIQSTAIFDVVNFSDLAGSAGKYIVIRFLPGSLLTTRNAAYRGEWSNCSFVKVTGLRSHNYAGTPILFSRFVHDIIFTDCSFTNDAGVYSDKQCMMFDDKYRTEMNFNGSKKTTFYNIEISHCVFNGFRESNVITMGSDNIRSVTTDVNIHHNVFKNISNYVAIAPSFIEGTCFNFHIHHNSFDSVMYDKDAYRGVHTGAISLYGWGEIDHNIFGYQYCNSARMNPLAWNGLDGRYGGKNARLLIHNNIDHHHISYSSYEISNNNSGPRIRALKLDTAATLICHNTTYGTKRDSYNGDYRGYLVDLVTHKVKVCNNIIINPEWDRSFDPKGRDNYTVAFISGRQPGFDSSHNYMFRTAGQAGIDTVGWKLLPNSAIGFLSSSAVAGINTDFYDRKRPGGKLNTPGALQFVSPVRKK